MNVIDDNNDDDDNNVGNALQLMMSQVRAIVSPEQRYKDFAAIFLLNNQE